MKKNYTLFVIISIGIMISGVANAQWALQTNPLGSGESAMVGKIQFVSATEGWINASHNGSLLHTLNGGTTWNIVTPFSEDVDGGMSDPAVAMSWVSPTHGWALKSFISGTGDITTNSNGAVLYGTTDGGSSWTKTILPKTIETVSYSLADLQGNWQFHAITAKNPDLTKTSSIAGWMYGSGTIDASGNCSLSIIRSSGTRSIELPMLISSRGKITINGDEVGFMSADKSTVIFTGDEDNDGYSLYVLQRVTGATYTTSDLQGGWQMHSLSVGKTAGENSGWAHALLTADASGNFSGSLVSVGGTNTINTTATIASNGEITNLSSISTTAHGFISADKKTFFLTMTGLNSDYNLAVFQKNETATYSLADLQGIWQMHKLAADDEMMRLHMQVGNVEN